MAGEIEISWHAFRAVARGEVAIYCLAAVMLAGLVAWTIVAYFRRRSRS